MIARIGRVTRQQMLIQRNAELTAQGRTLADITAQQTKAAEERAIAKAASEAKARVEAEHQQLMEAESKRLAQLAIDEAAAKAVLEAKAREDEEEAQRLTDRAEAKRLNDAAIAVAEANRIAHEQTVERERQEKEAADAAATKAAMERAAIIAKIAEEERQAAIKKAHDIEEAARMAKLEADAIELERQRIAMEQQAYVARLEAERIEADRRFVDEQKRSRDAEMEAQRQRDAALEQSRVASLAAEAKRITELEVQHQHQLAMQLEAQRQHGLLEQTRLVAAATATATHLATIEHQRQRQQVIDETRRDAEMEAKRQRDIIELQSRLERQRLIDEQIRLAAESKRNEEAAQDAQRMVQESSEREALLRLEAERKAREEATKREERLQQRMIIEIALTEARKLAEREELTLRQRFHSVNDDANTKLQLAAIAMSKQRDAMAHEEATRIAMEQALIRLEAAQHAAMVAAESLRIELVEAEVHRLAEEQERIARAKAAAEAEAARVAAEAEAIRIAAAAEAARVAAEAEAKRLAQLLEEEEMRRQQVERERMEIMQRFRAILCVQRAARTWIARMRCQRALQQIRLQQRERERQQLISVQVLQRVVRCHNARRELSKRRTAHVAEQAAIAEASRALQAHIQMVQAMREAEEESKRQVDRAHAAARLQSLWRGILARRAYTALVFLYRMAQSRRNSAAIKVQSHVRMILARRQLRSMIAKKRAIEVVRRGTLRWLQMRRQRRYQSAADLITDAVETTMSRWAILRMCVNVRESRLADARRQAEAARLEAEAEAVREAARVQASRVLHATLTFQRLYRGVQGRRRAHVRAQRMSVIRALTMECNEMEMMINDTQSICDTHKRVWEQANIRSVAYETKVEECVRMVETAMTRLTATTARVAESQAALEEYMVYEAELKRLTDEAEYERQRILEVELIDAEAEFATIDDQRIEMESILETLVTIATDASTQAMEAEIERVRTVAQMESTKSEVERLHEIMETTREAARVAADEVAAELEVQRQQQLAAEIEAKRLADEVTRQREMEDAEAAEQVERLRALEDAATAEIAAAEAHQREIQQRRMSSCAIMYTFVTHRSTMMVHHRWNAWTTMVRDINAANERKIRMEQQREDSAVVLQSIWRGRQQRKKRSREMKGVAQRLETANQAYQPHMAIGARAAGALDILLTNRNLHHVTKACTTLETVTRMLPQLCGKVVDQNAVPVLYQLIQSCNRSQPHLVLVQTCLSVLFNLAQNVYTRRSVFAPTNCVDILAELLQIYRDKDRIFLLVTSILNLGCTMVGFAGHMRTLRDVTSRMRSVRDIMAHKSEAEAKLATRRAALMARQAAKGISSSSSSSTLSTPRRGAAAFGPAPPSGGLPACIAALTSLLATIDGASLPVGAIVPPSPSVANLNRAAVMTQQLRSVLGSAALAAAAATASNVPPSVQATVAARALETTAAAMTIICQPPAALRTPARRTAGSVVTPHVATSTSSSSTTATMLANVLGSPSPQPMRSAISRILCTPSKPPQVPISTLMSSTVSSSTKQMIPITTTTAAIVATTTAGSRRSSVTTSTSSSSSSSLSSTTIIRRSSVTAAVTSK
jgi:hypothetical protein